MYISAELKDIALFPSVANAIAVGKAGKYAALASYTGAGALNPAFNNGAGTRLLHLKAPVVGTTIAANAVSAAKCRGCQERENCRCRVLRGKRVQHRLSNVLPVVQAVRCCPVQHRRNIGLDLRKRRSDPHFVRGRRVRIQRGKRHHH
jgi:hypothetical protein